MIQGSLEKIIQNSSFIRGIKKKWWPEDLQWKNLPWCCLKHTEEYQRSVHGKRICIKLCGCTCRPLFNKVFKVFHNHAMHSLFGNLNLVDGCKYNVYHVTFYVNFSIITKPSKFTLRYWNRDWRGNFLDSVYNIGIGAWQAGDFGEGF